MKLELIYLDSVGAKSGLQVTTAKDSESDSSASEKSDKQQVGNYV